VHFLSADSQNILMQRCRSNRNRDIILSVRLDIPLPQFHAG